MCEFVSWCALTSEAQAAWAQAAFSAIAIIFAGLFPVWQRKADTRRQVSSVATLALHIFIRAQDESTRMAASIGSQAAVNWNPAAWDSLRKSVESVPFHQLPDGSLVEPMLQISELVAKIATVYDREIRNARVMVPLSMASAHEVAQYAALIEDYATRCVDAEEKYLSVLGRVRRKIAKSFRPKY